MSLVHAFSPFEALRNGLVIAYPPVCSPKGRVLMQNLIDVFFGNKPT
jgi:hypothetical protein